VVASADPGQDRAALVIEPGELPQFIARFDVDVYVAELVKKRGVGHLRTCRPPRTEMDTRLTAWNEAVGVPAAA
jgi:hypothetical protein